MKTIAEYNEWMMDVSRDPYRILLIEIDYAAKSSGGTKPDGTVRTDGGATLPHADTLVLRNFTTTDGEVKWDAPDNLPAGTTWELWVQGSIHSLHAVAPVDPVPIRAPAFTNVAVIVVAVNATGAYSRVMEADLLFNKTQDRENGDLGKWADYVRSTDSGETLEVGTIRIASKPWLSDDGLSYDDFLIVDPRPEVEDSLSNFGGVGDFSAINPDTRSDWNALDFAGYSCRWLHGDTEWNRTDFRPVAMALNESCKRVEPRKFQFDITDGGRQYRRTFSSTEYTRTGTASSTIDAIMTLAGLPAVSYRNLGSQDWPVDVTFSADTTVETALREIVASIGAEVRVLQDGSTEVFIPDLSTPTETEITEHDILASSLSVVDTLKVYSHVVVKTHDDTETSPVATGANTGRIVETLVVETVLKNIGDANTLAAQIAAKRSKVQRIWSMDVLRSAGVLQVGDVVPINQPDLIGTGVVQSMIRSPLSRYSTTEVLVS